MKRLTIALGLLILVLPAAAQASPQPNNADFRNARAQCAADRGETRAERAAFRAQYGAYASGKCVARAARDEHGERHRARAKAVAQCRAEREDPDQFRADYGEARREVGAEKFRENHPPESGHGRNAFGRCVSELARAERDS